MFNKVTSDHEVLALFRDEDFVIEGEVMNSEFYIHCTVDNYSKEIKKRIKHVFGNVKREVLNQGFNRVLSYTPNIKFCKVLGEYKHLVSVTDEDGKVYEVIEWLQD